MSESVHLIGICGGSASGKTTLAKKLRTHFGEDRVSILYQDRYYIDQSDKFDFDGGAVNFDHPSAIDWALMREDLKKIKKAQSVEVPIYDFVEHKRLEKKDLFESRPLVILDGILIFSQPEIVSLLDEKIFIDTPEVVRLERRVERDMRERGREKDAVEYQFHQQVKPMHEQFVQPYAQVADEIISGEDSEAATRSLVARCSRLLG